MLKYIHLGDNLIFLDKIQNIEFDGEELHIEMNAGNRFIVKYSNHDICVENYNAIIKFLTDDKTLLKLENYIKL